MAIAANFKLIICNFTNLKSDFCVNSYEFHCLLEIIILCLISNDRFNEPEEKFIGLL